MVGQILRGLFAFLVLVALLVAAGVYFLSDPDVPAGVVDAL
jgi:hypothetical protein